MKSHIIVKAPLNTAFSDKSSFEGVMTESDAKRRCEALNKTLSSEADFSYKARKA